MDSSPISLRTFIFSLLFSTGILLYVFITSLLHTNSIVVFCDVGQGDGAYIRIQNQIDVVIDAGPDNGMMLRCLGKYMPFYDKQIEVAILSHPQSDHYGGLLTIIKHYQINKLYMSDRGSNNRTVTKLISHIKKTGTASIIRAGETISILDTRFVFLWPPPYLVDRNGVPRIKNSDDNIYSSVFLFISGQNKILFTGDSLSSLLVQIAKHTNVTNSVLKVAHHGSKNGTDGLFVSLAKPTLAVISVGLNNAYGHPSKSILDMFKALKIPVKRTDEEGDIVIQLSNNQ